MIIVNRALDCCGFWCALCSCKVAYDKTLILTGVIDILIKA